MSTLEILRRRRQEIQAIAREHGAGNVRLFGSAGGSSKHLPELKRAVLEMLAA